MERVCINSYLISRAVEKKRKETVSRRYCVLVELFCESLAEKLGGLVGRSIQIGELSSVSSGGFLEVRESKVLVTLKLYGEKLVLVLPVEFLQECALGLLKKDTNQILSEISDKDIVSISYLVGLLLNDRSLFPERFIYLQSVEQIEAGSIAAEVLLSLNLKIEDAETELQIILPERLHGKFKVNAGASIPSTSRSRWFQRLMFQAQLEVTAEVEDLNSLLDLRSGKRIPLRLKEGIVQLELVGAKSDTANTRLVLKSLQSTLGQKLEFNLIGGK